MATEIDASTSTTSSSPSMEALLEAQQAVADALKRKQAADAMLASAHQAVEDATAEVTAALRRQNDIQDALMGRAERKPRQPRQPRGEGGQNGAATRIRRPRQPKAAGAESS